MIYNAKSLMLAYKQRKMFADKQLKRWNVYQQTYRLGNSIKKRVIEKPKTREKFNSKLLGYIQLNQMRSQNNSKVFRLPFHRFFHECKLRVLRRQTGQRPAR